MDQNIKDLLESVNFIKDYMVTKMATKEEVNEARIELQQELGELRQEMRDGFTAVTSRMGGIDNRIDNEVAQRKDLENRVRIVVPNLPLTPERV